MRADDTVDLVYIVWTDESPVTIVMFCTMQTCLMNAALGLYAKEMIGKMSK